METLNVVSYLDNAVDLMHQHFDAAERQWYEERRAEEKRLNLPEMALDVMARYACLCYSKGENPLPRLRKKYPQCSFSYSCTWDRWENAEINLHVVDSPGYGEESEVFATTANNVESSRFIIFEADCEE